MDENQKAIAAMHAVTISREYGSGGGEVAARLAQRLEWQLVDHQIVAEAARELETHESVVQAHDEHVAGVLSRLFGLSKQRTINHLPLRACRRCPFTSLWMAISYHIAGYTSLP